MSTWIETSLTPLEENRTVVTLLIKDTKLLKKILVKQFQQYTQRIIYDDQARIVRLLTYINCPHQKKKKKKNLKTHKT